MNLPVYDLLKVFQLEDLEEVVNWQVHLSREIANRGITPAIDIRKSGTLRSERLVDEKVFAELSKWRTSLSGDPIQDAS